MNNDLISRSALLEKATNVTKYDEGGWDMDLRAVPVEDIENAQAVDAEKVFEAVGLVKEAFEMAKADLVPVVRCRYCVNWKKATVKDGFLICPKSGMKIMARTYCSYGDRRADNADQA
jgi:hypothetical protein